MKLLLNSTPVLLWQDIIHEAEEACTLSLSPDLESYLVFLLMRYTNQPQVINNIVATEFLKNAQLSFSQRQVALREVGDNCLLFSGLFPHLAAKRHVKISYFVKLGQAAYTGTSKTTDDLYELLAKHFVGLMDILNAIRQYSKDYPNLMPLQAYELWNDTGSQRALSILKQYTTALPLHIREKE